MFAARCSDVGVEERVGEEVEQRRVARVERESFAKRRDRRCTMNIGDVERR